MCPSPQAYKQAVSGKILINYLPSTPPSLFFSLFFKIVSFLISVLPKTWNLISKNKYVISPHSFVIIIITRK